MVRFPPREVKSADDLASGWSETIRKRHRRTERRNSSALWLGGWAADHQAPAAIPRFSSNHDMEADPSRTNCLLMGRPSGLPFPCALGNCLVLGKAARRYHDVMRKLLMSMAASVVFSVAVVAWCAAADPQPPDSPTQTPPSTGGPRTDVPPSPRDPGMVKEPETKGAPGAVVTPPVVDPKMAVNPEQPPTEETAPPRTEPPPTQAPSR